MITIFTGINTSKPSIFSLDRQDKLCELTLQVDYDPRQLANELPQVTTILETLPEANSLQKLNLWIVFHQNIDAADLILQTLPSEFWKQLDDYLMSTTGRYQDLKTINVEIDVKCLDRGAVRILKSNLMHVLDSLSGAKVGALTYKFRAWRP